MSSGQLRRWTLISSPSFINLVKKNPGSPLDILSHCLKTPTWVPYPAREGKDTLSMPLKESRTSAITHGCRCIDWAAVEQVQLADSIRALLTTDPWELFFGIIDPTYLELTMELCSTFHLQIIMMNYNDPGTVHNIVFKMKENCRTCFIEKEGSVLFMSPQAISSMLSMRMIERRRGTYLPQYRFAQSTEEEAYENIPDVVSPHHEDPPTQPPPPSRLVHATVSYANISERLT
ncbi:hypothetical protein GOBAR_AA17242 [Gossypium barbadense]|uniref:Uncharacterized protein n=1 Tax=Gossypium barbadense TaxID=3634 RepID=A0A2P5XJE9_GOSBA|nr:hypothetical protein GOBAR_AA17242 [Gossypium barbadense]